MEKTINPRNLRRNVAINRMAQENNERNGRNREKNDYWVGH